MSRFFHSCFHIDTLAQLVFVRQSLDWQSSQVDQFLAAVLLGCLHGESHKTPNCLSNRMPRTISTKPEYSLKWWATRGLHAPSRNTFEIARYWTNYRLSALRPQKTGRVLLGDARGASSFFNELQGKVRLIVTSPPYLDTTNYVEDQWLRLWFLGGPETPTYSRASDDRHTSLDRYWQFLREIWMGCSDLLDQEAVVVVRIGGRGIAKLELTESLRSSLEYGFKGKTVRALHSGFTSEIKNRQTNAFRPGSTTKRYEHDFVFVLN